MPIDALLSLMCAALLQHHYTTIPALLIHTCTHCANDGAHQRQLGPQKLTGGRQAFTGRVRRAVGMWAAGIGRAAIVVWRGRKGTSYVSSEGFGVDKEHVDGALPECLGALQSRLPMAFVTSILYSLYDCLLSLLSIIYVYGDFDCRLMRDVGASPFVQLVFTK